MTGARKAVRTRTQAQRSAESTEAMLDAAIELVIEHGARVSMMAIGRRSGFSHGLVLARFGSKAGLIKAVLKQVQREFVRKVASATGDRKGIEGLTAAMEISLLGLLDEESRADKALHVLFGEALGPDQVIREGFAELDAAFRRYVQEMIEGGQEQGDIDPAISPPETAALFVGMVRGTAMQRMVNPDALDLREVCTHMRGLIERLRSPPHRQGIR